MPLKYKLISRKVLAGEDVGCTKYYGQVCAGNRITFDKLCTEISSYCSATKGDVSLVLAGLETCMAQDLAAGQILQMGDLGNFRMSGGSRGTATEEEFTLHLMKRPRITFTSGKTLTLLCKEVKFTRANFHTIKVEEECNRPHAI